MAGKQLDDVTDARHATHYYGGKQLDDVTDARHIMAGKQGWIPPNIQQDSSLLIGSNNSIRSTAHLWGRSEDNNFHHLLLSALN